MTDAVPSGPRNVLLVGPEDMATSETCVDLISEADPEATNLLSVTFDRRPDELVSEYRSRHGTLPAKTGIIDVGGETRSAAASRPSGPGPAPVTIDVVGDPSDLTGLSIALSGYLDAWEETEETTVVCLHSLSAWISQTNEQRVYMLLHSIMGRLREMGAQAHFHINPDIHDEATINRFAGLMDTVVEVDGSGEAMVKTRRQPA